MNKNVKFAKELIKLAKELVSNGCFGNDIYDKYCEKELDDYLDKSNIPVLKFDVSCESVPINLKSFNSKEQYAEIVNKEFTIETDLQKEHNADYGILNNPSQIKSGDIIIYINEGGNFNTIDFTELQRNDKQEVINQVKEYLDNPNNFEMDYQSALLDKINN